MTKHARSPTPSRRFQVEDLERPQLKRLGKKTRQKMVEFLETGDRKPCGKPLGKRENLGKPGERCAACFFEVFSLRGKSCTQVNFKAREG